MSTRKYSKETGRFHATDSEGRGHTVVVFREFLESRDLDGNISLTRLLRSLRTQDGKSVNRIEKGEYRIFEDEIELTSDDPGAE